MYTHILPLLKDTLSMFEKEGKLNSGKYAAEKNAIGCAIGCHFTPTEQKILDTADEIGPWYRISTILETPSCTRAQLVRSKFGKRISRRSLLRLQSLHDQAIVLTQFTIPLAIWIQQLEEKAAKKR